MAAAITAQKAVAPRPGGLDAKLSGHGISPRDGAPGRRGRAARKGVGMARRRDRRARAASRGGQPTARRMARTMSGSEAVPSMRRFGEVLRGVPARNAPSRRARRVRPSDTASRAGCVRVLGEILPQVCLHGAADARALAAARPAPRAAPARAQLSEVAQQDGDRRWPGASADDPLRGARAASACRAPRSASRQALPPGPPGPRSAHRTCPSPFRRPA